MALGLDVYGIAPSEMDKGFYYLFSPAGGELKFRWSGGILTRTPSGFFGPSEMEFIRTYFNNETKEHGTID